ncbi:MFS transporter [Chloroflexota bacterium]
MKLKFYGWISLAGAMLVYFSGAGTVLYAFGIFVPSMGAEFGWGRSAIAMGATIFVVLTGIFSPVAGICISKYGIRKNIIFGNLIVVLGLLGMSIASSTWQIYLFYGVMAGVGSSFGLFLSTVTVANNWFHERRTLAISLVLAAGGLGGLVFSPFIAWLITNVGLQMSWRLLAGIHFVLAVGIAGILIRNKPEDLGQIPDGKTAKRGQSASLNQASSNLVYQTQIDWKVKDALKTRSLWLILLFSTASIFSLSILTIHQVAYLQGIGFSPMLAATSMGLVIGSSIVGRLLIGALGGRFQVRYLAAICVFGFAIGMILLVNIEKLPFSFIYLYAGLVGVCYGGILVCPPTLFGAYFGRANYSKIIGCIVPISTLVGASGGLIAGAIYDRTGSYISALTIAVAFLVLGILAAILARPPIPANR